MYVPRTPAVPVDEPFATVVAGEANPAEIRTLKGLPWIAIPLATSVTTSGKLPTIF